MAGRARIRIALLAAGQGVSGSVISLLTAVSSLVGAQLAPDPALATLPVTATVIGATAMIYPVAPLMARLGRRHAFLLGSTLGALGSALAMAAIRAGSFAGYVAAAAVLGGFTAFNQYYRFAAADAAPRPEDRARAISTVTAGGILGGFLGPFVASRSAAISSSTTPFLGAFAALFALCCGLALLQFFFDGTRISAATRRPESARPPGQILRSPGFRIATLHCAAGFSMMTLLMNATPLAMKSCGFTLGQSASVIQWHFVAMYAPALVSGSLIARLGVQRLILLGIAANLIGIAVATSGFDYRHFWFSLVCFGTGWSFMFTGGTTQLTSTYSEAEKTQAQGMNSLIVYLSNALASFSAGSLLSAGGWVIVNCVAIPILLLAGAVSLWSLRRTAKPLAPAEAVRPR